MIECGGDGRVGNVRDDSQVTGWRGWKITVLNSDVQNTEGWIGFGGRGRGLMFRRCEASARDVGLAVEYMMWLCN